MSAGCHSLVCSHFYLHHRRSVHDDDCVHEDDDDPVHEDDEDGVLENGDHHEESVNMRIIFMFIKIML